MKLLATVLASLTLVACGGGGDDSPPPTPPVASTPEGVYGGKLTGSTSSDFEALFLENGEFWTLYGLSTPSAFFVSGFVQGSGTSNSGSYTSTNAKDFGFAPAMAGTLSATYNTTAKTIAGTFSTPSGAVTFSGGPIPDSLYVYDKPATLSSVAGAWSTSSLTGESVAINVASNGAFTAAGSSGCRFSGTVTPRPSGKNVFNVALTFGPAPCALPGQTGTGIAITYPLANGQSQLVVVSVITQFDGLTFTNGDGQSGQDVQRPGQQNGTGIATGAVLASGG